ncbi:Phr family secreted Rap phosphatase inhibitor [Bacillus cereus group sp. BfR-BA-01331]|uniref:Phr family secreted Rap phosphatase inhibitor n=1 Tax=Bacillus cereus group sp. BfR-BA-01331 TaxID=2920307 RepID=UPI001F590A08|nr:Phr family secreted Rap phosphatase inhibitor [Bacillus cereus group sp. BfR-BA-01331]
MKKLSGVITGLALLGTLAIGLNSSAESNQYASRGDTGGAPARPDYVSFNKGDGGGAPANFNKGDGGAPADNRGDGGVSQL